MPKKILPLHEREGLKGIDPDESLEAVLELTSEIPAEDIAKLFFNDRAKFFILHRWLGTSVFEETLGQEEKDSPLLQTLRYELSEALLQLANNQNAEFLKVDKRTGPRGTTHLVRFAKMAAAACFSEARQNGEEYKILRWWESLSNKAGIHGAQDLEKLITNVAGQDGDTPDKKMLMSMHAGFLEGSPADRGAHLKLLKSMVEDNLGKARKN